MKKIRSHPETADWSFVPGPLDFAEPFSSIDMHDLAEYTPAAVAARVLQIPGVQLAHEAEPTWWDWRACWTGECGAYVVFVMTLLETDPPLFGGFSLDADCSASDLLSLWEGLRSIFQASGYMIRIADSTSPRRFAAHISTDNSLRRPTEQSSAQQSRANGVRPGGSDTAQRLKNQRRRLNAMLTMMEVVIGM